MSYRALRNPLNGRLTTAAFTRRLRDGHCGCSYDDAKPQNGSNHWSCTENNRNNARNVNFNNGNANNNNKYNSNVVRAVAASDGSVPSDFLSSVYEAYEDCLRGKTRSPQAMEYMKISGDDLPQLALELWSGSYKPGTSTCFLVKYPKWREVFAASFRDRIVHHWICLRLEPLFEERFESQGNVSFNCRKGFGTDMAVKHVAEGMKHISENYRKKAWVFRGDLVGFFMSIDKDLLWYLLRRFILRWKKRYEREGWSRVSVELLNRVVGVPYMREMYWDILLRTTEVVVMHHPERDCVLNSPPQWWERHMASNKSLFTSATGEPIGNLTTQQFANFLMSFFVSYVQYVYRGKNYEMAQFVDDFVLCCDDKRFLTNSIPKLEVFLRDKLLLTLHKNKRYMQPVSHGILFVGTLIKPGRLYLSNRTVGRFMERCEGYGRTLAAGGLNEYDCQHIEQTVNSYLGFCKGRETYTIRKKAIDLMGKELYHYFIVCGHYERIRARKKYGTITLKN